MAATFTKGQNVFYVKKIDDGASIHVPCTIVSVHTDDVPPYFTVLLNDGTERQTPAARLERDGPTSSDCDDRPVKGDKRCRSRSPSPRHASEPSDRQRRRLARRSRSPSPRRHRRRSPSPRRHRHRSPSPKYQDRTSHSSQPSRPPLASHAHMRVPAPPPERSPPPREPPARVAAAVDMVARDVHLLQSQFAALWNDGSALLHPIEVLEVKLTKLLVELQNYDSRALSRKCKSLGVMLAAIKQACMSP